MFYVMVLFATFLALWYLIFVHSGRMEPLSSHRDAKDAFESMLRSRSKRKRKRAALRESADPTSSGSLDRISNGDNGGEATDCSVVERFCARDRDCSILCREYKRLLYRCDASSGTCRPRAIVDKDGERNDDDDDDDDTKDDRCDARKGEFAMLVGYTVLGTALWQCVQMYRQFFDGSRFCEGGTFEMRADIREPSYRDCRCPEGTVRAVYKYAMAYESMGTTNLPHCIPEESWKLYRTSMTIESVDD